MKNILFIFTVLIIFIFSGCSEKPQYIQPDATVVEYPDSYTKENLNGYKTIDTKDIQSSSQQQQNIMYYANIKSKKFHLPSCTYAKKLDEYNVRLESNYEVLINDGYIPCKVCKP